MGCLGGGGEEIPAKDADPGGCWCVVGGSSLAGCEPCDGEALLEERCNLRENKNLRNEKEYQRTTLRL